MHFPPVNFGSCWVFECNIHRRLFYFCHLIPGKDVSLPLSCEFQCLQRSNVYVTSHVIHPVMWFIWPIISELENAGKCFPCTSVVLASAWAKKMAFPTWLPISQPGSLTSVSIAWKKATAGTDLVQHKQERNFWCYKSLRS